MIYNSEIVNLKNVVYALLNCGDTNLGLLQLINKRRGSIEERDEILASDIGTLVGNYVSVMLMSFKMINTLDDLTDNLNAVKIID